MLIMLSLWVLSIIRCISEKRLKGDRVGTISCLASWKLGINADVGRRSANVVQKAAAVITPGYVERVLVHGPGRVNQCLWLLFLQTCPGSP